MSLPRTTKRRVLIKKLRSLGFEGPYGEGRKHPFMRRGTLTLHVPNEHSEDVGISLLRDILRIAGISEDEYTAA
ncbi:MAG: type II toxin-antitoxin system HicA family toxin [Gaiellaceae bacterium]